MSSEEKYIFEVKPNLLINSTVIFFKILFPAVLIIGGMFYLKYLEIIKSTSILDFFIVAVVFVFTFLILFLILFEQNKKLKFFKSGAEYSDLFDTNEINQMDIKDIYYKKGITTSFILEKNKSEKKIIILNVSKEKEFENIKKKILGKEPEIKKEKPKENKMPLHQMRRKHRIDEIVSGKRKVTVRHPKKKQKDYLDITESEDDFVDVKKMKIKSDEEFMEWGNKKEKRNNVFKDLKNMKEKPKSAFKKVKELKK